LITNIRRQNGVPCFAIDYPRGFREVTAKVHSWRLRFECTGRDKLHYVFRTFGGEMVQGDIWLEFPEIIQRWQRRKNFRLELPSGTRIHFHLDEKDHEMHVHDISLGGALVSLEKASQKMLIEHIGKTLKHSTVVFSFRNEETSVSIQEILVKRWEKDSYTGRYRYGLQFTQLEKDQEETLKRLIYRFQRGFLRKRQCLED
jgi:hypothetical protein